MLKFLSEAVKYGMPAEGILKRCIDVIARNFCHLRAPNFNDIAFEIFSKILSHNKLAVRQEFQLYKIICDYLKAHQDLNSEVGLGQSAFIQVTNYYIDLANIQVNVQCTVSVANIRRIRRNFG